MSKKIIGPALPPHLQHLLKSQHSEEASLSDTSSKSPGSPSPKTSAGIDDDEDDGVLVLHVSDDELLVDAIERPTTQVHPPNVVSSCRSNPSKVEDMFGPSLPLGFKAGSRCKKKMSSESDDDSFAPELPPNFKMNSQSHSKFSPSSDEDSFGPVLPPNLKMDSKTHSENSDEESFGPVIPPNYKIDSKSHSNSCPSSDEDSFGPALPPNLKTGSHDEDSFAPELPPNFKLNSQSHSRYSPSSDEDSFGPALPPNFKTGSDSSSRVHQSSDEDASFGPALPPNFTADSSRGKVIGPTLPPGLTPVDVVCENFEQNSESDEDVVGPLPPTQDLGASSSYIQQQLEARALKMKRKLAGEDDDSSSRAQARETWMLELPPDRSGEFGLGPRQFRARAKLDLGDRSVWTDTPTDKQLRATGADQSEATSTVDLKSETEMIAMAERDRAMQKLTDKHNKKKKRKESLVDLHQKKLKKKQKKEEEDGKPKERRPFDRNLDLQANRFDEAQKKAILRKAQLLDDRFSRGESKFL